MSIPVAVHTAPGGAADLEVAGERLAGAAFRCADPALDGYLIIDFGACDAWYEDERNLGHPRDPFHRIEIVHSSRHVVVEFDGVRWGYAEPQREAAEVRDRVAFFNERVDVIVDGQRRERPVTPWS